MTTASLTVAEGPRGSVITRALAESPLSLRAPHNHGHAAWVFTSSHGGGLLSSDRVSLEANVEAGAALVLSTQASTKAYKRRATDDDRPARLDTLVHVGTNALACLLPDPLVAFRGARVVQDTRVKLEAGASVVVWDPIGAGRVSRGERWSFAELTTRVLVDGPAGRILTESTRLVPAESAAFAQPFAFDAFGLLVLLGPRVAPLAKALLAQSRTRPAQAGGVLFATSALADGAVSRVAATSTEALGAALRGYLPGLETLLGDDFFSRRAL